MPPHLLLDIQHVDASGNGQLARRDVLQQRRLAHAVGAEKPVPTARNNSQVCVDEEILLVRRDGEALDDDV